MNHRGFEIKPATRRVKNVMQQGWGIFQGETLLTIAENTVLAKEHIDDRLKSGVWKERQEEANE